MERPTTSPISERRDSDRPDPAGFTLVELLVVIGIIALLIGILVPTVTTALRQAKKTRIAASLQTIATALQAYKSDFGDIPRINADPNPINTFSSTPYAPTGSQLLTLALIGPDTIGTTTLATDGKKGPGFKTGNAGRTYGPYLKPDSFKFSNGTDKSSLGVELPPGCLLDGYGNPILYYPAALSRVNLMGYVEPRTDYVNPATSLYSSTDNDMGAKIPNYPFYNIGADDGATLMRVMLGVWSGSAGPAPGSTETTMYTGPYLLWSAGPDGVFGPAEDSGAQMTSQPADAQAGKAAAARSDDVTNFPR